MKNRATIYIYIYISKRMSDDRFFFWTWNGKKLGIKDAYPSPRANIFSHIIFCTTKTNFAHFLFANGYRSAFDNSSSSLFSKQTLGFNLSFDELLLLLLLFFNYVLIFPQIGEINLNITHNFRIVESSLGLVSLHRNARE